MGFGRANVVVAVPQAWIDVRTMADLDDVATSFRARHNHRMRVATKYINLTRNFFAAQGVVDYRIVESAGATEGAPAALRYHPRRPGSSAGPTSLGRFRALTLELSS